MAWSWPSCCRRSPPGLNGEQSGSPLSLQSQELCSAVPQTLRGMSEGDVTVLPSGGVSLDLDREHRAVIRLYSKNGGYHLRILSDGTVNGGRQENDTYDILRLTAVSVGVVVIKGEMTGRYLAMDINGKLYGSQTVNDECYFFEQYEENNYNTYRSKKYSWYVALKKNGQPKGGPDTSRGQEAILFLPRPAGSA
ncbi:hypothetical protein XENORESO_009863 [Xenotaenia resolanae]|uniref:Fibroblast growth factor n=1 Tax=Xenotaenia resolanae TaxID=208358 RepID=A0ABV0VM95_9TELE